MLHHILNHLYWHPLFDVDVIRVESFDECEYVFTDSWVVVIVVEVEYDFVDEYDLLFDDVTKLAFATPATTITKTKIIIITITLVLFILFSSNVNCILSAITV